MSGDLGKEGNELTLNLVMASDDNDDSVENQNEQEDKIISENNLSPIQISINTNIANKVKV